jgi:hypothetical protein
MGGPGNCKEQGRESPNFLSGDMRVNKPGSEKFFFIIGPELADVPASDHDVGIA